jgi:RHS repeat-associated protein
MSSVCSATTYYRYDPGGRGLSNVVAEYDSTGTRQARYKHGPGVDQPVEQLRAGSYYTYQKDGLGSTSKITDATQNSINSYSYSPWGDTTATGSLANPFQYTGREAVSGSSLYDYRARVYDPEARRFMGKDPAGMVDGTNAYAYVGGNPVNRIDPSGTFFIWRGDSYISAPEYLGVPPYKRAGWWCGWWCPSQNPWDYPYIHIHLGASLVGLGSGIFTYGALPLILALANAGPYTALLAAAVVMK